MKYVTVIVNNTPVTIANRTSVPFSLKSARETMSVVHAHWHFKGMYFYLSSDNLSFSEAENVIASLINI